MDFKHEIKKAKFIKCLLCCLNCFGWILKCLIFIGLWLSSATSEKSTVAKHHQIIWVPAKELNTFIFKKNVKKYLLQKLVWILSQLIVGKFYIHINFSYLISLYFFLFFTFFFFSVFVCEWGLQKSPINVINLASN